MFIQRTYCGNMFKFPEKIDISKKGFNSKKKYEDKLRNNGLQRVGGNQEIGSIHIGMISRYFT